MSFQKIGEPKKGTQVKSLDTVVVVEIPYGTGHTETLMVQVNGEDCTDWLEGSTAMEAFPYIDPCDAKAMSQRRHRSQIWEIVVQGDGDR